MLFFELVSSTRPLFKTKFCGADETVAVFWSGSGLNLICSIRGSNLDGGRAVASDDMVSIEISGSSGRGACLREAFAFPEATPRPDSLYP